MTRVNSTRKPRAKQSKIYGRQRRIVDGLKAQINNMDIPKSNPVYKQLEKKLKHEQKILFNTPYADPSTKNLLEIRKGQEN